MYKQKIRTKKHVAILLLRQKKVLNVGKQMKNKMVKLCYDRNVNMMLIKPILQVIVSNACDSRYKPQHLKRTVS